jgi:hypothetical protein
VPGQNGSGQWSTSRHQEKDSDLADRYFPDPHIMAWFNWWRSVGLIQGVIALVDARA